MVGVVSIVSGRGGVRRKRHKRGFTLVELMIVVAIIGILAALAMQGVFRYLNAAKASEAVQSVGSISRCAQAAFERELMQAQTVTEGSLSITASHRLCGSASPVPTTVPAGKKYQPNTREGFDFQTGTDEIGWNCLRFALSEPTSYQYNYTKGSSPVAPANPAACTGGTECYEAAAVGDLNATGKMSRIARTGHVNPGSGALKAATLVYLENESD